jgi:multiple sugar transport system permease protein
MVQAFVLGSTDLQTGRFTLEHLGRMGSDLYFVPAVRDTLLITAVAIPIQVALGLAMAMLVQTRFAGHAVFLYLCAVPIGISDLAAGLIWLSIFTERGYLNALLFAAGWISQPAPYLTYDQPGWLFAAILMTEVWRATAFVMLILLSGLQLIPKDYAETAQVFGASPWQTLRHVTFPLLRASLQTALIIRTILAFEVFAPVMTLTGRLVPVLAGESYLWYSLYRNPNVASAYGALILLLSAAFTWWYLRFLRPRQWEAPG